MWGYPEFYIPVPGGYGTESHGHLGIAHAHGAPLAPRPRRGCACAAADARDRADELSHHELSGEAATASPGEAHASAPGLCRERWFHDSQFEGERHRLRPGVHPKLAEDVLDVYETVFGVITSSVAMSPARTPSGKQPEHL